MDSPPVPDELLEDIFLRIPDPADLVRVSAACVSFRGLVADRTFLRKYRKLHIAPLLGFLGGVQIFCPAVPPHPSAPAASAVALAADFSFSFLPGRNWVEQDVRDGRNWVLLDRISTQMVVCDPLHHRYLLLPPIPDDNEEACHTFLAPSGDDEQETAFRVIRMARRGDELVALVFSSSTGQWQAGPSHSWSDSFADLLRGPGLFNLSRPHYAYGCFYWLTDTREMLMLDTRKMEFSIADAPPEAEGSCDLDIDIVEAGEGRPGMFVLSNRTHDLSFIIRRNIGGSSVHWQLEKTISLGSHHYFLGSIGRQLFLMHDANCFSLDVKTFQREVVCASKYKNNRIWPRPYSNFPPSLLSSPTVASGKLHNAS
ncbi:unnamed protein product [Alopecurus aequalis]